jgi:hypothetical protein
MIQWVGSSFGGWNIDPDLIPTKSTILSAGLGNDITFDECVIGLDPSQLSIETVAQKKPTMVFMPAALSIDDRGITFSSGRSNGQSMYDKSRQIHVRTVSIFSMLTNSVSVLKMNIEGGEYPVLMALKELHVPQVAIRFHHRKEFIPYDIETTELCILKMLTFGYKISFEDAGDPNVDYEVLFTLC